MLGEGKAACDEKRTAISGSAAMPKSCRCRTAHFDAYTIAFGIRNVTHIEAALREARRVLKPGGRFLCLEFSKVAVPGLDALYDAYSFKLLPKIGGWVARRRRLLSLSGRKHPPLSAAGGIRRA